MISQLKLTVLCGNRVENPRLMGEQGLSILVETIDGKILFDTGQTGVFLNNAINLGINLSDLKAVFLSHGHYDHTGGLKELAAQIRPLKVFCHPNLFNKKFNIIDEEKVDIGVPWEKAELENLGVQFNLKTRAKELLPDVWISGEIPRLNYYERIDESYQEQVLESFIHDELHDDMALIIHTIKGLVILLGCSHSGPINTIKHAMRILKANRIHAIIGGMHLKRASEEKIEKILENLIKLQPDYLIPLHCCGFRAIDRFFRVFKDRVLLFNVGDTFIMDKFVHN